MSVPDRRASDRDSRPARRMGVCGSEQFSGLLGACARS